MTKTKFTATDSNGKIHTRSTERSYSHTVVVRGGYQHDLANANDKAWDKTNTSNYRYNLEIAEGRSKYFPSKRWRANDGRSTAEEIAAEEASLAKRDAEALERAIAAIAGCANAEEYCAKERARMVAAVEARKARGEYEVWHNAGWCGRLDLAQKLAAKERVGDHEVAILEAHA